MKVTLYPMVHIAQASFYDQVSEEMKRCRYVLYEGVTWRTGTKAHPLYDLVARNLGLASQEVSLKTPAHSEKVNLDMERSEFRERFFHLPLKYVLWILLLRRLLWAVTLPRSLRGPFVRHGLLRLHEGRDDGDDSPLDNLIVTARDQRIVQNLERFYRGAGSSDATIFTAIIFGARHMQAISVKLRELGFRPGSRRWVEVLHRMDRKANPVAT